MTKLSFENGHFGPGTVALTTESTSLATRFHIFPVRRQRECYADVRNHIFVVVQMLPAVTRVRGALSVDPVLSKVT